MESSVECKFKMGLESVNHNTARRMLLPPGFTPPPFCPTTTLVLSSTHDCKQMDYSSRIANSSIAGKIRKLVHVGVVIYDVKSVHEMKKKNDLIFFHII